MSPEQDCLQYLTASSGTVASFNWDTSSSTVSSTSQFHLSSQYYDICIRRARSYCSICYSPQVVGSSTAPLTAASYGLSASSDPSGAAAIAAVGSICTGVTTLAPGALPGNLGQGDYLDITGLQTAPGTAGLVSAGTFNRICGAFWAASGAAHATLCSYATLSRSEFISMLMRLSPTPPWLLHQTSTSLKMIFLLLLPVDMALAGSTLPTGKIPVEKSIFDFCCLLNRHYASLRIL